jgi:hypothetical protein
MGAFHHSYNGVQKAVIQHVNYMAQQHSLFIKVTWMRAMAHHNNGIALTFNRTGTPWFDRIVMSAPMIGLSTKTYPRFAQPAVKLMRAAADLEDSTEKHPVTPAPVVPARELLADFREKLQTAGAPGSNEWIPAGRTV